jgi:hypothetical protein
MVKKSKKPLELEDFVKFSNFSWNFFQIDIFSNSPTSQVKTTLIFIFQSLVLFLQSLSNVGSIYPFKFEKFVFIFSAFATISYTNIKFSSIWWSQERLRNVAQSLPARYSKIDGLKFESGKFYKKFRTFMVVYSSYTFMPVTFMFLESFGEYMKTGEKVLPMLVIYPFDTSSNLGFAFAFFLMVYGYTSYWMANVTSDRLLYGFVTAISVEFRALRVKITELKFLNENELKKELSTLIHRHNQLIANVRVIQRIFSASFFLNFALSSLYICFHLFLFTTAKDSGSASSSIMFCVYSTLFILLQCYFGQMLRDESDGVMNGIVECQWENVKDVSVKKAIVMMILRVQKPVELTIFEISPINIEQFGNVSWNRDGS